MKIPKVYEAAFKRIASKHGARYIILTGGRGSGKSFMMMEALKLRIFQNFGDVGLLSKYTYHGTKNTLVPIVKDRLGEHARITNTSLEYKSNRYIIDGIKTSYSSKLKSIDKFSFWLIEEAADIQKVEEFDSINRSIRGGVDSLTVMALNPTSKLHWIYKNFFKNIDYKEIKVNGKPFFIPQIVDNDIIHVHTCYLDIMEYLDAPFLKDAKKVFEEDEKAYAKGYLGLFAENTGETVMKFIVSDEIDYSLPSLIGSDFGYHPDPSAMVRVFVDNDKKMIYARVLLYEWAMSANEIANEFTSRAEETFICDTNLKSVTEDLKQQGINIFYKNQKVLLKEQFELLKEYTIITNSQELINELAGFVTDDKKGFIANEGDHAIDAFRYAAFELIR